jgi:glc operon protein GlcG
VLSNQLRAALATPCKRAVAEEKRNMMRALCRSIGPALILATAFVAGAGAAEAPIVLDRASISLAGAKKVVAAAEAEAVKNGWALTFTIVDDGGRLVYFVRMDGAPLGTIEASRGKAETAIKFRAPTKMVQDMVAQAGPAILSAGEITALAGGYPIMADGKLIGAIGVSGGFRGEDDAAAAAGLKAIEKK